MLSRRDNASFGESSPPAIFRPISATARLLALLGFAEGISEGRVTDAKIASESRQVSGAANLLDLSCSSQEIRDGNETYRRPFFGKTANRVEDQPILGMREEFRS